MRTCFIGLIVAVLGFFSFVNAEIIEIQNISEILPAIESVDTLVLFDMDDTLTDSTISLGTGSWRKYIRSNIEEYQQKYGSRWGNIDLHDKLTSIVANKVPVKAVEDQMPQLVASLQSTGIPVFVFTARGKSKWYATEIDGVDRLTRNQLLYAGFDFARTQVPQKLKSMGSFYADGVIFSSPLKKGLFLKKLLQETGYQPKKIVFIDDKRDQVESMEKATQELGIPFVGFWYTRADQEHENFDPFVTTIQLKRLLETGEILTDEQASRLKGYNCDPDQFFKAFLDKIDPSKI